MKLFQLLSFVISFTVLTYGYPSESKIQLFDGSLPVTDEQILCMREATDKIVERNPELKWWFEEGEKAAEILKQTAQECESLSGIRKQVCYGKLKISALAEYYRLVVLLPKDRKEIIDEIKTMMKSCLKN